jgi:two-component system phosphate regulon sensor histidine kinase PhoR
VIASVAPPAAALVWFVAGAGAPIWAAAAIAAGLVCGTALAIGGERWIVRRAERLEEIANALARRTMPSHLISAAGDALSGAERSLLAAGDALMGALNVLEAEREEFEAILRGMSEAVVVTGSGGEVVMMNGAARRVFGLAADLDYRGRDFVELCRDPRLQDFVGRATASARDEPLTGEIQIHSPAPRHLEVSAAPLRQAGRGAAAHVMVFHDVSRLKAFENARADFIANLTHELRTPLSAIRGYAETLAGGVDDPAVQRRFLSIIERQSRRLARLLDDLVSLSDLERGLTPLDLKPLDPRSVLEDCVELMRDQAERRGVSLEMRCAAELSAVLADADRLHQVIVNLLDNAVKYTPRGGSVTLEARAASMNDGAQRGVELIVADTGEGIPAADIPRLTERFYRVDRARSRELGGTGLGLAIVKHIVQLHHGALKIESRLREGTKVTVWLPAGDARPAS